MTRLGAVTPPGPDQFRHLDLAESAAVEDAGVADGRAHYVSLQRGVRTTLVAGPFATHLAALEHVAPARELADRIAADPQSVRDGWGTLLLDPSVPGDRVRGRLPLGRLNADLHLDPCTLFDTPVAP